MTSISSITQAEGPELKHKPVSPIAPSSSSSPIVIPPRTKPVDMKLTGHVQLDFCITDSSLEGNESTENLRYMTELLDKLKASDDLPELKEDVTFSEKWDTVTNTFKQAWEIHQELTQILETKDNTKIEKLIQFSKKLGERMARMSPGEQIGIPMDYLGSAKSHCIFGLVTKEEDNSYSITVVNTGDGVDYHSEYLNEEAFIRISPILCLNQISQECISDPEAWRSLYEYYCFPLKNNEGQLAVHMLYRGILSLFNGKEMPPPEDLKRFMLEQRSGTCSWKVLTALLRKIFPLDFYKKLKICLRIANLKDQIRDNPLDDSRTPSELFGLENAAQKIMRALGKSAHNLTVQQKEEFTTYLEGILSQTKALTEKRKSKEPPTILNLDANLPQTEGEVSVPLSSLPPLPAPLSLKPIAEIPPPPVIEPWTAENIAMQLSTWDNYCTELYSKGAYNALLCQANQLIKTLPLTEKGNIPNFWNSLSNEQSELEPIMVALSNINNLLFKSCFQIGKSFGDEEASAFISYSILARLTERIIGYNKEYPLIGVGFQKGKLNAEIGLYQAREFSSRFAHDGIQTERMQHARKMLHGGDDATEFLIHALLNQENFNDWIEYPNMERWLAEIKQKAVDLGIKRRLSNWVISDFGQQKLLPPFLWTLNRQAFITAYFSGGGDFSARFKPYPQHELFEIITPGDPAAALDNSISLTPVAVNGGACYFRGQSFNEMRDNVLSKIESKDLRKIAKYCFENIHGFQPNPNSALIDAESYTSLSIEEARDLLSIVSAPSNMVVWQAIQYFSKYWDRLAEKDYQYLFECFVFQNLHQELQNNPASLKPLLAFVEEGFEEFQNSRNIEATLFLQKVGLRIWENGSQIENSSEDYSSDEILQKWIRRTQDLLAEETAPFETKSALRIQLAHLLSKQKSTLSADQLENVLIGKALLRAVPAPTFMQEGSLERELTATVENYRWQLQELLENDPSLQERICSNIAQTVCQVSASGWKKISLFQYQDSEGQFEMNLLTGQIIQQRGLSVPLPKSLLKQESYIDLFGKNLYSATVEGGKRYTFTNGETTYRIEYDPNYWPTTPIIERLIDGQWCCYLPKQELHKTTFPKTMKEGYTFWVHTSGSNAGAVKIFDQNDRYCFRSYLTPKSADSFTFNFISQINPDLSLATDISSALPQLTRFEDVDYVQVWQERHIPRSESGQLYFSSSTWKIKEIKLPRYNLDFEVKREENGQPAAAKAYCKQISSHFLSKEQQLHCMPYLNKFLLLEDLMGAKKLLLPVEDFYVDEKSEDPLVKDYTRQDADPRRYLEIDLDEKGIPTSLTQESALYLAYLAIIHKDYATAHNFLKISYPSKDREKEQLMIGKICNWLIASKDHHPKGIALCLRAALKSLKKQRFEEKLENNQTHRLPSFLSQISSLYDCYHMAEHNATNMHLSLEEEKELLQLLFNFSTLSRIAFQRLTFLQTKQPLEPQVIASNWRSDEARKESLYLKIPIAEGVKQVQALAKESLNLSPEAFFSGLITRPGANFVPYFIDCCLNLPKYLQEPQKTRHLQRLAIIGMSAHQPIRFLAEGMRELLENPAPFEECIKKMASLATPHTSYEFNRWFDSFADVLGKIRESKKKLESPPLVKKAPIQLPNPPPPILPLPLKKASALPLLAEIDPTQLFTPKKSVYPNPIPDVIIDQDKHPKGYRALKKHPQIALLLKEFNEQKKDFYKERAENPPLTYQISKETSTSHIEKLLESEQQALLPLLQKKLEQILALANRKPTDQLTHRIKLGGELHQEATIEQLLFLYWLGDSQEFLKACPGLGEASCELLNHKLTKYLILATKLQQIERSQKRLQEVQKVEKELQKISEESHPEEYKEQLILKEQLENQLSERMLATRVFTPHENRDLLTFEYLLNILVRPSQKEGFELLFQNIDAEDKAKIVEEFIMQQPPGEGKSKVTTPYWAKRKANGRNLVMVIVPAALYETNKKDLREISSKLGQEPVAFDFNRNTPFTEKELRAKLWELQNCIVDKKYLITTPESIQCLRCKYFELLEQIAEDPEYLNEIEPQLQLLEDIIQLFKQKGCALIDEADTILAIKRMVNFPIDKGKAVPKERIKLLHQIYQRLLQDDLQALVKLKENQQENLTADVYQTQVATIIANDLIASWPLEEIDPELLKAYLLGQLKKRELPGLEGHPQKRVISVAKEILTSFFPLAFKKNGYEHFCRSKQSSTKVPKPCKGSSEPDENLGFGNIYETLLYSIHTYLQDGLKVHDVDQMVQKMQRLARQEAKEKKIPCKETKTAEKFCQLFGIKNLFNMNQSENQKISEAVKTNKNALFFWLKRFVFPEVAIHTKMINSNGYDLIDSIGEVHGFTATPWDRKTYHPRLDQSKNPALEKKLLKPSSEMAILDAIWQKTESLDPQAPPTIHTLPVDTPLRTLQALMELTTFDCLLDVGALLKGISNEQVAKTLVALIKEKGEENLRGAIYFNDDNQIVVLFEGMNTPIPIDVSLMHPHKTYYDEWHTIGADIQQKPRAKALLTYAHKPLNKLKQGPMRMRQLLSSQLIEIVVSVAMADAMDASKKISFLDIIRHGIIIEGSTLGERRGAGSKDWIHHISKERVEQFILNRKSSFLEKALLSKHFEPLIVDNVIDDPYLQFGKPHLKKDSLEVLKDYHGKEISLVEELFNRTSTFPLELQEQLVQLKDEILAELNKVAFPAKEELPAKMPENDFHLKEVHSHVEVEKELELEVNRVVQNKNKSSKAYSKWYRSAKKHGSGSEPAQASFFAPASQLANSPRVIELDNIWQSSPELEPYTALFSQNLMTTENFAHTLARQQQLAFDPEGQKKASQLLIVKEVAEAPLKAIMVDPKEAGWMRKCIDQVAGNQNIKLQLMDLTNSFSKSNGAQFSEEEAERIMQLKVQAKFYNAHLLYSSKEWDYLKGWLSNFENKKGLKTMFEKIIAAHPGQENYFKESKLKIYLESLANEETAPTGILQPNIAELRSKDMRVT